MSKIPENLMKERQFLKRKIRALMREYDSKVTYDFSRYIYVGAKENCEIQMADALRLITACDGYEAHRYVIYQQTKTTNIYVRFADAGYALAASERLLQQENYCVDNVKCMLVSWYLEEMLKGNFPWTLALVSIEGRAEHTNPLSQDVLQGMLTQFGDPRINSYQNGNQVEHVQVLFSSMSEALGASIAHGRWFRGNFEENLRFYYSIRLMSSEKEATLLRSIQPNKLEDDQKIEALEMDYFVQKMEIKTSSPVEETSYLSNQIEPTTSQDHRQSPRVREFRRQFSRGRGNGGRGKRGNFQWQYEDRGNFSRRFHNYSIPNLPVQGIPNF